MPFHYEAMLLIISTVNHSANVTVLLFVSSSVCVNRAFVGAVLAGMSASVLKLDMAILARLRVECSHSRHSLTVSDLGMQGVRSTLHSVYIISERELSFQQILESLCQRRLGWIQLMTHPQRL